MNDAPRYGRYEVMGRRNYRDHPPGSTFEARLDKGAARRAIARGDIRLLNEVQPCLQPGSYEFPHGWLPAEIQQTTEAPKGASLVRR